MTGSPSPQAARPRRAGGRPSVAEAHRIDEAVREAALELFVERGFDATSIEAIAAAAGTTKASLYARFPDKGTVFRSVLARAIQRSDPPVPEHAPLDDLEGALNGIAEASLRRALDPMLVKLGRIAITHADRFPEIARDMQSVSFWPHKKYLVEVLEHHVATGAIVAGEPEVLAELFLGMVSGVPAGLAAFGTLRPAVDQRRHTRVAVDMFLRSLRP